MCFIPTSHWWSPSGEASFGSWGFMSGLSSEQKRERWVRLSHMQLPTHMAEDGLLLSVIPPTTKDLSSALLRNGESEAEKWKRRRERGMKRIRETRAWNGFFGWQFDYTVSWDDQRKIKSLCCACWLLSPDARVQQKHRKWDFNLAKEKLVRSLFSLIIVLVLCLVNKSTD